MWRTILITAAVTTLLTVLILNLQAGERHIRYELQHTFASDPAFTRTMDVMLGPGIQAGNSV